MSITLKKNTNYSNSSKRKEECVLSCLVPIPSHTKQGWMWKLDPFYLLWMQMQECSTAPTTHRLHRKRGTHEWEGPHKRKTDSTYSVMCKILEKENWELFQQMQKMHRAKPQHPFITHAPQTLSTLMKDIHGTWADSTRMSTSQCTESLPAQVKKSRAPKL